MKVDWSAVLAMAAMLTGGVSAKAADPFYIGTWKIESARVGPWWEDASRKPDASERDKLVEKTVVMGANAIRGPRQVACAGPRYAVKEYSADMLFQGAFGEMHERNKALDPATIAAAVGFRGARIKTLETGCAVEIDFHFIDETTATFALNNYIYFLKKVP